MTAPSAPVAGSGPTPAVELTDLRHDYGDVTAVSDVSLTIRDGEFLTLLGPSGSGKSTILMMIAGFLNPTAGEIRIAGRPVSELPPHKRNIGMVFQSYALFPHMTIEENVAYPLKMRRMPKREMREKVAAALSLVGLEGMGARSPHQLSGGQQQRVALARAFVFEPQLLLMDEPLGALDKRLRQQMQIELKRVQQQLGITVVFVTHDQEEALTMSDRIVVMRDGKLEQVGTPETIYGQPSTSFAASFLGDSNLIHGRVTEARDGAVRVAPAHGLELWAQSSREKAVGDEVTVCIRPERIQISHAGASPESTQWRGVVEQSTYLGDAVRYLVKVNETSLIVKDSSPSSRYSTGDEVSLAWKQSSASLVEDSVRD